MTKQCRNPNDEKRTSFRFRHFNIRISFVIRHSGFVIYLAFHPLNFCPELAQFFIEMFVTAVDVVNAADFGDAVGF